jgi:beta-lactamase superfamily II metal-dependent hydrolase
MDNLLAIDKAANNTSLVICLKWSGLRFLFTGDAEIRSWKTMNKHNVLKQVNFLKVSHHASHNGTPPSEILDKILPEDDEGLGCALISTYEDVYNNVPDGKVIDQLRNRCSNIINIDKRVSKEGGYVDISFDKDGYVTIQTSNEF